MSCSTSSTAIPQSFGQPPHQVRELGGLGVAEAGRRLVEQQDARLGRDGARHRQQPAAPVGEVLAPCESRSSSSSNSRIVLSTVSGSGALTGQTRSRT